MPAPIVVIAVADALHYFPDVSIRGAALRQSGGDRADRVPVTVSEKEMAKETGGCFLLRTEQPARHKITCRGVGVGKGVSRAPNIIKRSCRAGLIYYYVALI